MSKRLLAVATSLMMAAPILAMPGFAQTTAAPAPAAPAPMAPAPAAPAPAAPAPAAPAPAKPAAAMPHHPKTGASAATRMERVKKLQTALNAHGAKLTVDGQMGPKTKAALTAFQKANNLKPTGRPDKETRDALMK